MRSIFNALALLAVLASHAAAQVVSGTSPARTFPQFKADYYRGPVTNAQDVIIDTDLGGGDIDDFLDLWLAHKLMDNGELNILAVTHNTTNGYAVPCIEVINRAFERGHIPIGQITNNPGYAVADSTSFQRNVATNYFNVTEWSSNAVDATSLFLSILATRPPRSLTLITTGSLRNLSNFWAAGSGLMAAKLNRIIIVAGVLPHSSGVTDFNLAQDAPASQIVHQMGAVPIVWCGVEVGWPVNTATNWTYNADYRSPLYTAMLAYGAGSRPAWAQMAVLYAARGLSYHGSNYFTEITVGTNFLNAGTNQWLGAAYTHQRYIVRSANSNDFKLTFDKMLFDPLPLRNLLMPSTGRGYIIGGGNPGGFVTDLLVTENVGGGGNSGALVVQGATFASHFYFGAADDTYVRGGAAASTLFLNDNSTLGPVSVGTDLRLLTVGRGIQVKEGSNAKMGTATLASGLATVSTTAVGASSRVFLTARATANVVSAICETNRVNGTSFQIRSASASDANTVSWLIFDPSP